jgi:hypothetical protein
MNKCGRSLTSHGDLVSVVIADPDRGFIAAAHLPTARISIIGVGATDAAQLPVCLGSRVAKIPDAFLGRL